MSTTKSEKWSSPAAAPPAGSRRPHCRSSSATLLDITLVESEEIGTVGVGESTIPPMRVFHNCSASTSRSSCAHRGDLQARHLVRELGKIGDRYIHSFGRHGKPTWLCEFHHFWLRGRELGFDAELGEYCVEWLAAKAGKFATSPQSEINYAYHIDATLYAKFLRKLAEGHGVKRVEGKIKDGPAECGIGLHRIADAGLRPVRSKAICSSTAPASAAC